MQVAISQIKIVNRFRKDFGDIEALADSIMRLGLLHPVVIDKDYSLICGERRIRAMEYLGTDEIEARIVDLDASDLLIAERDENETHKPFTVSERVAIGEAIENRLKERWGSNQHVKRETEECRNCDTPQVGRSDEVAAKRAGFDSKDTYRRAKAIVHQGAPELVEVVDEGKIAVSTAAEIAKALPKKEQREIVAKGEEEILKAAAEIKQKKAAENKIKRAEVRARKLAEPASGYRCIVIDPPWPMEKIERDVRPNQVGFEYPTMTEEELALFPAPKMAESDCHLFLWTTHKFLPMAFRLSEVWGFRYVCTFVWLKPGGFQPIGLPQYNTEFALYCRKGSPEFLDTKQFFTGFQAPRREHSRKPDEFYDVVRRVCAGPRIDVFSREPREGFDQYGNEADKFAAEAAE